MAKGLTQEALAAQAGFDQQQIWKMESGNVSATLASLGRLASALDVSLAELVDVGETSTPLSDEEFVRLLGRLSRGSERPLADCSPT